ncbi:hypothetical protein D0T25_25120 [Duganella sp. BJB488]|uniref:hypothetical protein n=1 Tax=unclassified Duganella TaxID=2636909 RepID=UPI000E34A08E|nr:MULTISPECIES: hypothetical protein [unclassified Duganella]RFP12361.1 hypothetical protein D0T26_24035 [Duganella sp. BJB489]RFP16545.1 hypothetical protein D0T25_25120 [Duganella sp. BJB488]RFP30725.1 hypothetical protein D0T24_25380 [Duganella sp. BJB480]
MKPYQIAMGVALAAAAGLVLFGDKSSSGDIAEPVARNRTTAQSVQAPAPRAGKDGKPQPEVAILRLTPRATLVGESGEATFASGEGVFQGQNWNPPPPPPPPVSNAPPPAPVAPPMPFTVLGKAVADGAWEVYLARGDKTYVVKNQTVIDGTYRVEKIAPPLMSVTYLPLNQVQQINIGVLD